MAPLSEQLLAHGIRLRSYKAGDHRTTCPQCSASRRKKSDPCLSVTVADDGGAVWNCWHCNWAEGVQPEREEYQPRPRRRHAKPQRPTYQPGALPQKTLDWFTKRGIGAATLERNGVGYVETWMPGCGDDNQPFFREGTSFQSLDADISSHHADIDFVVKHLPFNLLTVFDYGFCATRSFSTRGLREQDSSLKMAAFRKGK